MSEKQVLRQMKKIMKNPDEERSLQTSNNVSEFMFENLDRMDLIEALCYWRNKYDALQEKINQETHDQRMQRLLAETSGIIMQEGPMLPPANEIPLFRAYPENPDFLIRETGTKQEIVRWNECTGNFDVVSEEEAKMVISIPIDQIKETRSHDVKRRKFTDGLMIEPSFLTKIRTRITVECWGDNDHHAWNQLVDIKNQIDADLFGREKPKVKDSYFHNNDDGYAICRVERLEEKK